MEELLDAIVNDESPSKISDQIKDILFAKSAERIDAFRPVAADSLFGNGDEIENEIENSDDEEGVE